MTAPERIWIDFMACNKMHMAYDEPPENDYSDCRDQYTRSNLIPALEAAAEERGRIAGLREAAAIAENVETLHDWEHNAAILALIPTQSDADHASGPVAPASQPGGGASASSAPATQSDEAPK